MAFYDYAGNEVTEFEETTDIKKKFKGKNVIWLGDSLIDYETPEGFTVAYWFQKDTQANCYNWAQGGTSLATIGNAEYDAFNASAMAEALTTKNFTNMDEYAESRGFKDRLAQMKKFDFSTAQYIIIEYGTNDVWKGCTLDNGENSYDTSTSLGSLRTMYKTLLEYNPELKIIQVGLQPWDAVNGNTGLKEYEVSKALNDGMKEVCEGLGIPFIDVYRYGLFNEYSEGTLQNGVHLTHEGKLRYAALIENFMDLYFSGAEEETYGYIE